MNIRSTAEIIFYAVQNGLVEQVAAEGLTGRPAPAMETARPAAKRSARADRRSRERAGGEHAKE